MGTSLASAHRVADALADTQWRLFELADAVVGTEVDDLLRADELAFRYDDTRRALTTSAANALGPAQVPPADAPTPPVSPPGIDPIPPGGAGPPAPAPPGVIPVAPIHVRSVGDLDHLLDELRAALEKHEAVVVTWQPERQDGG
jgi:hypothetical protein